MSITQQVADFVAGTKFQDLPKEAIERAKEAIFDCVGVTLAGAEDSVGKKIIKFIEKLGSAPQSTVIGGKTKVSSPLAALANGTMAHALDYDDVGRTMIGHPSAPVAPAVFALGEAAGASGRDILTGYVLGVEVETKLGASLNPGLCDAGWHSTGVLGSIGAAAAGAKILSLNSMETAMALSIAASQAGGFLRSVGTMLKPLQAGHAARNGVMACLMASEGFTAPKDILDGPWGFFSLYKGEGSGEAPKIIESLGSPFDIVSPGLGLKPYPSCLATHPSIDATLWLKREHGISPGDIESIDCFIDYYWANVLRHTQPKSALEAKFSMQFCVSMALLEGAVGLVQFKDERLGAPEIQDLMRRIEVHVHPDLQTPESVKSRFTIVTIHLKNGRELSHRVDKSKGQPGMPLTQEELAAKYMDCAQLVLPRSNIDRSIEALAHLEELDNIGGMLNLLTAAKV